MDKFLLYLERVILFIGSIITLVAFCLDVRNAFTHLGFVGGVSSIVAFPATILLSPLLWGFDNGDWGPAWITYALLLPIIAVYEFIKYLKD
jgi:hypothetical protein